MDLTEGRKMVALAIQQINPDTASQQAGNAGFAQHITQAIQNAAAKTGVNFAYLLNKAQQESSLDPNAKSSASSATGLFQFTSQTWLREVKAHGAQYGLSDYADHISVDSSGAAHVKDPIWRNAILSLRKDPQVSAEMAGELDKENTTALKSTVGGKVGGTELYLAHFLGAGGASDFISAMRDDPNTPAANVLPDAAANNAKVFYNADGSAKTVGQIYKHFAQKFDAPSSQMPTTLIASSTPNNATAAAPSTPATNYVMASASNYTMSHVASTVTSGVGAVKANPSSLFATMVLAQMNTTDPVTPTLKTSEENKKNAMAVLGGTA